MPPTPTTASAAAQYYLMTTFRGSAGFSLALRPGCCPPRLAGAFRPQQPLAPGPGPGPAPVATLGAAAHRALPGKAPKRKQRAKTRAFAVSVCDPPGGADAGEAAPVCFPMAARHHRDVQRDLLDVQMIAMGMLDDGSMDSAADSASTSGSDGDGDAGDDETSTVLAQLLDGDECGPSMAERRAARADKRRLTRGMPAGDRVVARLVGLGDAVIDGTDDGDSATVQMLCRVTEGTAETELSVEQ